MVSAIVGRGRTAGVDTLDTAIGYGDSEARLGEAGVADWRIVTKLPPVPSDCADVPGWCVTMVAASLQRLRVSRLYGLLMHRAADLAGPRQEAVISGLRRLKETGRVAKTGVSVYSPDELQAVLGSGVIDLVQLPLNVLDRRFLQAGYLSTLRRRGIEVHVRSVFLQGLLLLPADARPARFARWSRQLGAWDSWLAEQPLSALEACLAFAFSQPDVDGVVVGVDSLAHFDQILGAARGGAVAPPYVASTDPDLINPSRWGAA
jgi:aryl-alcohol dehydrogenase-like predicted oxidoreductase